MALQAWKRRAFHASTSSALSLVQKGEWVAAEAALSQMQVRGDGRIDGGLR